MIEPGGKAAVAIADCGILRFRPARSELDLQRSLGLTTTGDWGPFACPTEDSEIDARRGAVTWPRLLEQSAEA